MWLHRGEYFDPEEEIEGAVVAASIQIRETFPLYEVVPMRSLIRLQCDTEDVNCVRIELPFNSSHSFFYEHLEPIGASIHIEALRINITFSLPTGMKFLIIRRTFNFHGPSF